MHGPELCKFWYRLHSGDMDYDLSPQEAGQVPTWNEVENSEPPVWWPWWLNDFDLHTALGLRFSGNNVFEHGRSWRQPWRNWALENGVAPGQLFCVEVGAPEIHKSGWEVIEYDEEWDAHLLEVAPLSPYKIARLWEADLRKTSTARAIHMLEATRNAELVDRDLGSLYIQQFLYCPSGGSSDWQVPTGRSLVLQTTRHPWPCAPTSIGASGRDDDGDFNKAMEDFVVNACKANPYLSPAVIQTLELRR